ncbi:MAG TPA: hypothetical protein VKG24_12570 [Pseudolabrys sp.]|jgi:phosphate transport system substrate-binding protein|nr:hypothetical protein [Pseudolabrys sp.]
MLSRLVEESAVATFVNQTKNSIGYVEYAYVLQNKMTWGFVQNKAGKFAKPDAASFQAAAAPNGGTLKTSI